MKHTKRLASLVMVVVLVISATMIFASASGPIVRQAKGWVQMTFATNNFDVDRNGTATMSGTTEGNLDSTKVSLSMYLEKLVNGNWVNVISFSDSTTTNWYVDMGKTRAVAQGYNYRLRTVHTVTGPRGTDTETIISPSVWY